MRPRCAHPLGSSCLSSTESLRGAAKRSEQGSTASIRYYGALFHRFRSRSEEHTSELQSLMRISYAVFCLKKKIKRTQDRHPDTNTPNTILQSLHTTQHTYNSLVLTN